MVEVGFAHAHRGYSCFVRSNGVVEIELAGSILLVKRTDTLQIALRLQRLRFILLQLRTHLVCLSLVLVLIDNKQHLVLIHISTFCKQHLLKIALNASAHFYELLSAYTTYIFAVNLYVFLCCRSNNHCGKFGFGFRTMGSYQINSNNQSDA